MRTWMFVQRAAGRPVVMHGLLPHTEVYLYIRTCMFMQLARRSGVVHGLLPHTYVETFENDRTPVGSWLRYFCVKQWQAKIAVLW